MKRLLQTLILVIGLLLIFPIIGSIIGIFTRITIWEGIYTGLLIDLSIIVVSLFIWGIIKLIIKLNE